MHYSIRGIGGILFEADLLSPHSQGAQKLVILKKIKIEVAQILTLNFFSLLIHSMVVTIRNFTAKFALFVNDNK